jgi:hypothetical protein
VKAYYLEAGGGGEASLCESLDGGVSGESERHLKLVVPCGCLVPLNYCCTEEHCKSLTSSFHERRRCVA